MAEAAVYEQIDHYPEAPTLVDVEPAQYEQPLFINVTDLDTERFSLAQAHRFVGAVAVSEVVETEPDGEGYSVFDALQLAAEGDKPARHMIRANVKSDQIERTLKSGHITEVPLERDEQGVFKQYGHTTDAVHANNLRYGSRRPQMRQRSMAETRNKFRLENVARTGLLEDYYYVIISRAADDMDKKSMDDEGFFTDTMSMAIQATTSKNGQFTLESAFVAGKKTPNAERHDAETVETFYEELGDTEVRGKSATDLLDSPKLIHKSLMPNGVVDIVKRLDDIAGTFFGKDEPRQDYIEYRKQCNRREASFEPRVEAAVGRLLSEADTISSPEQASIRLGKISAEEMIDHAIADETIDANVFGTEAAYRIEHARYYYDQGEMEQAMILAGEAKLVETSRPCPGGVGSGQEAGDSTKGTGLLENGDSAGNKKVEDCDFVSKKCPVCGEKNAKTRVRNGVYHHVGKSCKG